MRLISRLAWIRIRIGYFCIRIHVSGSETLVDPRKNVTESRLPVLV